LHLCAFSFKGEILKINAKNSLNLSACIFLIICSYFHLSNIFKPKYIPLIFLILRLCLCKFAYSLRFIPQSNIPNLYSQHLMVIHTHGTVDTWACSMYPFVAEVEYSFQLPYWLVSFWNFGVLCVCVCVSVSVCVCVCVWYWGWTQCLVVTREAFDHLSHASNHFGFCYFSGWVSCFCLWLTFNHNPHSYASLISYKL
jgi:hypothetical protein